MSAPVQAYQAVLDLHTAEAWAAYHLADVLDAVEDEARNVQAYAIRAHLECALTPGLCEQDVLDYCQHVFAVRFLCDWTDEEAATIAAGALAGWTQRVQRNPERYTCACTMTDPSTWYVYYGIPEPGSQWEWNPNCPIHHD